MLNEPAVALKLVVVALAAMETVEGTVMVPVEVNERVPPAGSGALVVKVQTATAPAESEAGLQDSPLSVGLDVTPVTMPPVVLIAIWLPSRLAPTPPETPIEAEVAPVARVTVTVATLPLKIRLELIPVAIQV